MVKPKTVVGFFDSISEAQEAVQLLLLSGFAKETMHIATQTDLTTTITPTDEERRTGRFYFSLFGSLDNAQQYLDVSRRNGTFLTIHSVSIPEAELAGTLLKEAGSMEVREAMNPASSRLDISVVSNATTPTWGPDQSMKFVVKYLSPGKQGGLVAIWNVIARVMMKEWANGKRLSPVYTYSTGIFGENLHR